MLQELGLIDIWRHLHESDQEFTFYSARYNIHSRIDYFFMFNKDYHRVKDCTKDTFRWETKNYSMETKFEFIEQQHI